MVLPPTGPLQGALMAMPGRKLKAPHRHTPTSTHDDTHPTQVIETRWVRPIGPIATCIKPATTVPLSPGTFLTDPTSPKQQAAWRRNATTKQSYTIYAARGERNNSHMPQHNQVQDSTGREGGRVTMEPVLQTSGSTNQHSDSRRAI